MALSYEKKVKSTLRKLIFHPFLFALYPVLVTYSVNVGKVRPMEMLLPGLMVLGLAALVWGLFWLLLRERNASALCATVILLVFALYQPMLSLVEWLGIGRGSYSRHVILLWTSLVLIIASCFFFIRNRAKIQWIGGLLNSVSLIVTVIVLVNIALVDSEAGRRPVFQPKKIPVSAPKSVEPPDIYYILLDGYGRSDVLKELYEYDNSHFTLGLEKAGFYIASRAFSNYGQTLLSLSSTFNMNYITGIASSLGKHSKNRSAIQIYLFDNRLIPTLRSLGYKFVSFSSGYSGTDFRNADHRIFSPVDLSEFQNILISQSPIPHIMKSVSSSGFRDFQYDVHRDRIKFVLSEISKLEESDDPKFVFAHILAPHPPFVFGPRGEELSSRRDYSLKDASHYIGKGSANRYIKGYAGQAEHLSRLVLKAVEGIIEQDPDAIIIIQGDHGPGGHLDWESLEKSNIKERWGILSAFRVPKEVQSKLYDHISPVNTFRLILSSLYGANLPLLEDAAYFSTWSRPYDFVEVTARVNPTRFSPQVRIVRE